MCSQTYSRQAVSKPSSVQQQRLRSKHQSAKGTHYPLLFTSVSLMHQGFQNNPLYGKRIGYKCSNDPFLIISSTGYADDTMTYCESWKDQYMMHEWMREFCH